MAARFSTPSPSQGEGWDGGRTLGNPSFYSPPPPPPPPPPRGGGGGGGGSRTLGNPSFYPLPTPPPAWGREFEITRPPDTNPALSRMQQPASAPPAQSPPWHRTDVPRYP